MNTQILNEDVQQFINNHLTHDLTKLILKGSPFQNISIQELANQILAKKKSENKLPTWFLSKEIYFPNKISIEQSSSEITARYKSNLTKASTLVDLTGGFGVDTYYFSKNTKRVFHCEIDLDLSQIVSHNFRVLKANNIQTISGNGIDFLKNTNQNFECIYIDPSRRNTTKGKVFLLEDCLPNVPENIDFLFTKTRQILIKTSPIIDIKSVLIELKYVKEVHVIAIKNEVKEVLFIVEKNTVSACKIKTINFLKNEIQQFDFDFLEVVNAKYASPKKYLFEPNAAILKAGGFQQISNQLNVFKLHQHSHLYTLDKRIDFPGRTFKVNKVIAYDKKKIKKMLPSKKANIAIRNFPKSVAQIRKDTAITDGGKDYLFFSTDENNKLIVLFCEKI